MLKLTRLTDYAVVILSCLSRADYQSPLSASELFKITHIPEPTVAKILKILSACDLVHSIRGIKGGYCLGRPLDRISIKDVIVALDGPIALTACVSTTDDECELSAICHMHGRWNQVNRAIITALETVTIADMLEGEQSKQQPKKVSQ